MDGGAFDIGTVLFAVLIIYFLVAGSCSDYETINCLGMPISYSQKQLVCAILATP